MSGLMSANLSELLASDTRLTIERRAVTEEEMQVLRNYHLLSSFSGKLESVEQLRDAARGLVRKTFAAAVFHLGEKEALRVWAQVAKKRRAGKKGSRRPERDEILLSVYDTLLAMDLEDASRLLGSIGKRAHHANPGQFGQSADAIGRQLRRLIKKRKQEAEQAAKLEAVRNSFRLAALGLEVGGGMTPASSVGDNESAE